MARLNEPPVAPTALSGVATGAAGVGTTGESLEALKRRFIRQNRDLAKNNSSQSLRIRSLENEVSRLLADNLELREQILGLQNEVHVARKQAAGDVARKIKDDLTTKLAELTGLVEGLRVDQVDDNDIWQLPVEKAALLSPSHRQYRERQPLAELMQDALMPTITEHKSYPRQTLTAEEIRASRLSDHSGASGSPDLGPPPVAHFEFSSSQESQPNSPARVSRTLVDEDLLPSVNLETRRKRKDSGSKVENRRNSALALSPVKMEEESATTTIRTGAKRKLADRDVEKPIQPPKQGDFTFNRRAPAEAEVLENKTMNPLRAPPKSLAGEVLAGTKPTRTVRKVLGDKSVNMSPKKANSKSEKPPKHDLDRNVTTKSALAAGKPPSRGRRTSSMLTIPPQDDSTETVEIQLQPEEQSSLETANPALSSTFGSTVPIGDMDAEESHQRPETPGPDDLFSPTTGPSVKAEGCDTPPPTNLSAASNTTEGGQRPSRRARSAVNYAEPSLIAKMRRPGKQMVDAISGLQDPRRTMNPSSEKRLSSDAKNSAHTSRTIIIKREPLSSDSDWTSAPHESNRRETTSPLRERSTDEYSLPLTFTDDMSCSTDASRGSATSSGLSTVIASSRKRREQLDRRNAKDATGSEEGLATAREMEELDLYEFKDSSSPAPEKSNKVSSTGPATSSHRRHSSIPKNVGPDAPTGTAVSMRAERAATRRRSMML